MARRGDRTLTRGLGSELARGFFLEGTLGPVIKHYEHPKVTGLENLLGQTPPLILAANHCSHMDTPLILNSLRADLRRKTLVAAAADYFFANRLRGLLVSMAVGAVPLDRQAASKQGLAEIDQLLKQGWCMVLYPEGSRSQDGQLHKGRTGVARLALSAHAPVIPVGITGTYHAMPKGRSWPVSGHVEVQFGKPLTFDVCQSEVADQDLLRAITDQIMHEIMLLGGQSYVNQYTRTAGDRQGS
jgi:1-acyl-sn-glycerol-3-phosphate acyltransferase